MGGQFQRAHGLWNFACLLQSNSPKNFFLSHRPENDTGRCWVCTSSCSKVELPKITFLILRGNGWAKSPWTLKFRLPSAEQFTYELFFVPQTWKWYWMMLSVYQFMFQGQASKNQIFKFKGKLVGEEPMGNGLWNFARHLQSNSPMKFYWSHRPENDTGYCWVHVPRSNFQKSHF